MGKKEEEESSVRLIFRALRPIYGVHGRPAESTICRFIKKKIETTGSLIDEAVPVLYVKETQH